MKIRIGFGLGTRSQTHDRERFIALVEGLEERRFDSLWFSDRISGEAPDPVVAMAVAAARRKAAGKAKAAGKTRKRASAPVT